MKAMEFVTKTACSDVFTGIVWTDSLDPLELSTLGIPPDSVGAGSYVEFLGTYCLLWNDGEAEIGVELVTLYYKGARMEVLDGRADFSLLADDIGLQLDLTGWHAEQEGASIDAAYELGRDKELEGI